MTTRIDEAIGATLVATAALLAGGCYQGADALDRDPAATDGGSGADHGEGPDSGSGEGGSDGGGVEVECGPDRSPLRRLTNSQYLNTVEALFPGFDFSSVVTLMPADATAHGFENAAAMQVPSPALIEGYQRVALSITRTVFADADTTAQTLGEPIPALRAEALILGRDVIEAYGPRIFRRPLVPRERDEFVEMFESNFEDTGEPQDDFIVALAVTFQAMMQAPSFLYIVEHGEGEAEAEPGDVVPLDSWEMASRLSYLLWDSMPDDELFAAARADELRTLEQIEAQARRMIDAPPARAAVRGFHRQWLHLDDLRVKTKDSATHPLWSEEILEGAYEQLGRFVEHVIFEGEGTIESLLTSAEVPVDARVAPLLDVEASGEGWQTVALDPERRRGLLTLPGFLAMTAHPVDPSPVLRGVFIRERILCASLPPPPDEVDASLPVDTDGEEPTTNRERYEEHSTNPECAGCHRFIDGVGFPLENYDAIGLYRTEENGIPIDASGELVSAGDIDGPVEGPMDLIERLASSQTVQQCVATQWFRYAFAREEGESDICTTEDAHAALVDSGGDIRELLVSLVLSDGFRQRRIPVD